jgi:hypothetical protein
VPIAGKLFFAINDIIDFQIFGTQITLHFSVPFSWKIFFFAALAFGLGNAIWQLCSPEIIKNYSSYADFVRQGRTVLDIKHYFLKTMSYFMKRGGPYFEQDQVQLHLKDFLKAATGKRFSMLSKEDFDFFTEISTVPTQNVDRILGYEIEKDKEPDLYHFVVKRSQNLRYFWLMTCGVCYVIGFVLVGINFFQSIWTVIKI